jgi:hypothetical protein
MLVKKYLHLLGLIKKNKVKLKKNVTILPHEK